MKRPFLKNFMLSSKSWSRGISLIGCLSLISCGTSVLLNPEGTHGGVVRYLYNQHKGPMMSSHRGEAFEEIKAFCNGTYVIVQEGPTQGRKRVVEGFGPTEVIQEEWWGIRFACQELEVG